MRGRMGGMPADYHRQLNLPRPKRVLFLVIIASIFCIALNFGPVQSLLFVVAAILLCGDLKRS